VRARDRVRVRHRVPVLLHVLFLDRDLDRS
jgi:hypothetical protein